MAEEGFRVTLNVYDLSQGLARQLSITFLGKAIEAIWHTGVVVYGNEYYFGGGIQHSPAGTTPYGTPMRVIDLGETHVSKDVFESYLDEISPRYTAETYSLLTHNCNNFSNEIAQFLVGAGIPDYILQLPNEVMSSPMGALMLPMIQNLESTLKSGAVPQVPQFRPSPSPAAVSSQSVPRSLHPSFNGSIFREGDNRDATNGSTGKPGESNVGDAAVAAVKPAAAQQKPGEKSIGHDGLGDARTKVQDEITEEFASIMATGTLPASEAAALATRKVMQKYGHIDVLQS